MINLLAVPITILVVVGLARAEDWQNRGLFALSGGLLVWLLFINFLDTTKVVVLSEWGASLSLLALWFLSAGLLVSAFVPRWRNGYSPLALATLSTTLAAWILFGLSVLRSLS
jgi:hypothetical protein